MQQIKLSIYPVNDGFGVFVTKLSGEVFQLFKPTISGLDQTSEADSSFIRTERLKKYPTLEAAKNYINSFQQLPLQDQVNKIAGKNMTAKHPKHYVISRVQYFAVKLGHRTLTSTCITSEIDSWLKIYPSAMVVPTVAKQVKFERDDFYNHTNKIVTLATAAKAGRKTDIVTNFKGIIMKRK